DVGTSRLIAGESAVLLGRDGDDQLPALVQVIAETGSRRYGAFLVLEVWAGTDERGDFVVRGPAGPAPETVDTLVDGLRGLPAGGRQVEARLEATDERA